MRSEEKSSRHSFLSNSNIGNDDQEYVFKTESQNSAYTDFDLLIRLKRWTKSAKSSVTVDNSGVKIYVDKSVLERSGTLFQQYSHLIDKVILNDEAIKLFCEAMDIVNEKIKPLVGSSNENVEPSATKEDMEHPAKKKKLIIDDVGFLEPDPIKTKGSGKILKMVNGNLCHGMATVDQNVP
ncbi:hypothetical protein DVH24_027399 [Malus domestica]|uniref:Uncharacterized protein n=1 Tax=Malus domestica TaxID=3750 RepID=A0A498H8G2_MALDO|nr:hypothetical protein DVH24_027399 [Malus domestica]